MTSAVVGKGVVVGGFVLCVVAFVEAVIGGLVVAGLVVVGCGVVTTGGLVFCVLVFGVETVDF